MLPTKDELLADLEADPVPPVPVPDCIICMEPAHGPTTTKCKHTFCLYDLIGWLEENCTCPICRAKLYRTPTSQPTGNSLARNVGADFRITRQPVTGAQVGLMAFGGNDASDEILRVLNTYIVHGCIIPDYQARTYVVFDQGFMNHKQAALLWVRPSQTAYGNLCPHEWHLVSESVNQTIYRLHEQTPTGFQLFMALDNDVRRVLGDQYPDYGLAFDDRRSFQVDMYEFFRAVVRWAQVSYEIKVQNGEVEEQDHDGSASS